MRATREFYDRRAELYDLAFSWDVRLGFARRRLLEPACGGGRMLAPFARRGFAVAGVDQSRRLLEIARERLRAVGVADPDVRRADMADFDLGRRFDAAICPVSSFGYLPDLRAAAQHLECMARHLETGSRYLVQLDLRCLDPFGLKCASEFSSWELETPRGCLRTRWFGRDFDAARRIETQVSRFEFVSGPEAGSVWEDAHEMRVWSFDDWSELIDGSSFLLAAVYDGGSPHRPRLRAGPELEERPLTWFELVRG
jgi:SAM-dependent methyltransferase